jgi:hypothetical protein
VTPNSNTKKKKTFHIHKKKKRKTSPNSTLISLSKHVALSWPCFRHTAIFVHATSNLLLLMPPHSPAVFFFFALHFGALVKRPVLHVETHPSLTKKQKSNDEKKKKCQALPSAKWRLMQFPCYSPIFGTCRKDTCIGLRLFFFPLEHIVLPCSAWMGQCNGKYCSYMAWSRNIFLSFTFH